MLLKRVHKRILVLTGGMSSSEENTDYYVGAVKAIYSADYKGNKIKRVNVNVPLAPMGVSGFKRMKEACGGTLSDISGNLQKTSYRGCKI
ncbi:hypothetical protein ATZ36_04170 [Candidatus Endomicrobiellum trichonymphae]|uniref:Uncharacterized protein n=1 Tax=Endomicrobium trichonymphae TaxID=1408204 RepID=A0A1E5IJ60_ENDTX|nr:hypothetical protein ATZ36_04305 [Candidatus Endomicrobium trichonymphae]OEG70513.1 hypothetical protein ATZ36_04170 [Candidatus Endomicrobium trichonymphae]